MNHIDSIMILASKLGMEMDYSEGHPYYCKLSSPGKIIKIWDMVKYSKFKFCFQWYDFSSTMEEGYEDFLTNYSYLEFNENSFTEFINTQLNLVEHCLSVDREAKLLQLDKRVDFNSKLESALKNLGFEFEIETGDAYTSAFILMGEVRIDMDTDNFIEVRYTTTKTETINLETLLLKLNSFEES